MSETPIQDMRHRLLDVATELTKALSELNKFGHGLAARLVSEADSIALQAADEKDAMGSPKVQTVTYGRTRGQDVSGGTLPKPAPPGKRACSLCHSLEPHPHRAKNCPNAHLVRAQEVFEQGRKNAQAVKRSRRRT